MTLAQRRTLEAASEWLEQRERGTLWAMRLVVLLATCLGRGPMRLVVRCIALYYALFDRRAREASTLWLGTVLGNAPSFWQVYRHILHFTQVTLDRFFLLRGKIAPFEFSRRGNEYLEALAREKKGALLLGAHLGSFEALRAAGDEEAFPVHIVGHFANAKMINGLLEALNPKLASRVIHVGDDPLGLALSLRERIESGNMVALLGDRVGLNERNIEVEFFGRPARFPAGPFLLAAALRAPVYLVFGLYREPRHYALHCELFAERITLPRLDRQAALQAWVQAYAARLEHYAKSAPYNWFNFYDFWKRFP